MKKQLLLLLVVVLIKNISYAQTDILPIAKERPADYEYLSAPDSAGNRTMLKMPSMEKSSAHLKLPYPIIFIHGLNSNSDTWNITTNWMDTQYGLTYGGRLDYCLNFDDDYYNSNKNYYPTAGADNAFFTPTLVRGDYYYLNFDIGYNGSFHPTLLTTDYVTSDQASIVKQGLAVKWAIAQVLQQTGRDKVILMGHSMGGLAAREYIQNSYDWQSDGLTHVAKIVTSGTPHGGSNSSAFGFGGVSGLDEQSEAVRDLRRTYTHSQDNGVYLYGGLELQDNSTHMDDNINVSGIDFYNVDVNCNTAIGNTIIGLNQKAINTSVDYSCIVGECPNCLLDIYNGDGVVNDVCANLNNFYSPNIANVFNYTDNSTLTEIHTQLTEQNYQNMEGLDEPNEYALSYELQFDTTYTGFTTMQPVGGYPYDYDDFKFTVPNISYVNVAVHNIALADLMARILNSSGTTIGTIHHSNGSANIAFTESLSAGNYYLEIYGTPTTTSYLNRHTFVLHRTSSLNVETSDDESSFTISPNPFTSQTTITISSTNNQQLTTLIVSDVLGHEIKNIRFSGKQYVLEKGDLSAGIYFVQLTDENKNCINKKIIIQ